MSQTFEDCVRPFCVRCADVGLDCNCVIHDDSEEKVIDKTIMHIFEYHAINPEEMTTFMRLKIRVNTHMDRTHLCLLLFRKMRVKVA